MYSWWSAPLGNVRVLLVCFAGIALSSLGTWPVSDLKVASGKPKRKHCSKWISQEQEEKENSKKSRPFKQMPIGRAPVFLLFFFVWNRHTRDDLAAMLNLHYVTWSGIGQSDIFRQWKQQQVRLRSDSKVWSEFTLVLLVIAFFAVTNIFSAGMWSLRFSFFRSCVFHYMRCTIIISKNKTSERVPRCSTFRLCVSV